MALSTLKSMALPLAGRFNALESQVNLIEQETAKFLELFRAGPSGDYPNFSNGDYHNKLTYINYLISLLGSSFSGIAALAPPGQHSQVMQKLEAVMARINKQYQSIATAYNSVSEILTAEKISDSVKTKFRGLRDPAVILAALRYYARGYAAILDAQTPSPKKPGLFSKPQIYQTPDEFLISILKNIKNFRARAMKGEFSQAEDALGSLTKQLHNFMITNNRYWENVSDSEAIKTALPDITRFANIIVDKLSSLAKDELFFTVPVAELKEHEDNEWQDIVHDHMAETTEILKITEQEVAEDMRIKATLQQHAGEWGRTLTQWLVSFKDQYEAKIESLEKVRRDAPNPLGLTS